MHISWSFVDKRNATISALEAYSSMTFVIKNTDEDIRRARDKMSGVGSPNMDGMPHAHNPLAMQERLAKGIDEIDTIKERYRQAVEYMNWFKPAWNQLSDDERYILGLFHVEDCEGAAEIIAEHFGIDRKSAYNRKYRAVDHLSMMLYGK